MPVVKDLLRRSNISDSGQQFLKIIAAACPLHQIIVHRGRRVYVSYRCTKKNGKICCKNGEVKRDDIEQLVLRKLQKFLSGKTKGEQLIQAYSKQLRAAHALSYFHLKYCEEEMKVIKRQIENVVGILTKQPSDALIAQLNRLEEQQANYQYQLEKLEKDMTFHKISKEELYSAFLWASEILVSNDADRYLELIDRCVRKIILTRDEIIIHWDMGFACEITDPQNSPFTCIVNRSELRRKTSLRTQI